MAFNSTFAFLPEQHVHYLQLHAHMGLSGWFLLPIIGVGSKLLPMFLLAHNGGTKKLNRSYNLINAGLVLFIFDRLLLYSVFLPFYVALVAGGVGLFL